jgi:hypothetical protein
MAPPTSMAPSTSMAPPTSMAPAQIIQKDRCNVFKTIIFFLN